MKGNEAVVEAALKSKLGGFFGYPITPATEILEGLAVVYATPKLKIKYPDFVCFKQMESEIGAINAVLGFAATGKRAMTATSGLGLSLKSEGISYLAGMEIPAVIVNVMRGGPGLGHIKVEQGDYLQATKGCGHGDYNLIVLAPNSVKEMASLTSLLFNLTDRYRTPGILLADAFVAQMEEKIDLPTLIVEKFDKHWALTGAEGRERNVLTSHYNIDKEAEAHLYKLHKKFVEIEKNEQRHEEYLAEDANILITAYGISSRVAKQTVNIARKNGFKVGLYRPITLWPFPSKRLSKLSQLEAILDVELNFNGQMIEDIELAVKGRCPIYFYGRGGGFVFTPNELYNALLQMIRREEKYPKINTKSYGGYEKNLSNPPQNKNEY